MAKIPFFATVGDAYNFVFRDWRRFFRLGVAWIVLGCILFAVILLLLGPEPLPRPHHAAPHGPARMAAGAVLFIYSLASNIAFAVAWHRAVLLGEVRAPGQALRFRRREWRFLLYSIGIGLLFVAIYLVGAAVIAAISIVAVSGVPTWAHFHPKPWSLAIGVPLAIAGFVVLLPCMGRLSLGLPAIAVEEPKGVFGRAWRRGRRNGWRLIWGPVACTLPLSIIAGIFGGGQTLTELLMFWGGAWYAVGFVMALLFYACALTARFLALAGGVSFLSLSYRQLAGPEPAPEAATG